MWGFYATSMTLMLLSVGWMIRKYAAPKVSILIIAVVSLAWLTALSVVALVPIDVYSTLARRQTGPLETLWNISYWATQVLTWAVIPILQGYVLSGAFTIPGRIASSFKRLWLFYLIIGSLAVVGVLLALAAGRLQLATLPKLIVTLSNTYGLVVIIALLGYGLVEIPRILWRRSFPEARLKWHYHRVGRAADKLTDASAELEKALAIVLATSQQIPRSDATLRGYMDSVIKFTDEFSPVRLDALARSKVDFERLEESDLDYAGSVRQLAKLRARLKLAIAQFVGYRGEYVNYVKKALDLEGVCKSRQHAVYIPPSGRTDRWAVFAYTYKCVGRPWVLRLVAAGAAALSAVIVWSEATIGSGRSPDLSPFSLLIHSKVERDEFLEQLLVALLLGYMCACAYFSLFRLGNFGFYHLVSGATWAYSLLLSGSLLARFAPALCFNFLHVIRMNEYLESGQSMVFIRRMGSMNDVPVLGASFNTWFPLVMVVYVALLTFNWWERCCSRVFIARKFRFDTERADDEHTSRGMRLVQMEGDALGRGYPIGEGIGLFGVSTSLGGSSAEAGMARGSGLLVASGSKSNLAGSNSGAMELAGVRPAASGGSSLRAPLFGSSGSSSSLAATSAAPAQPPSQAHQIRDKYRGGSSLARSGAGETVGPGAGGGIGGASAATAASRIDDLFAGVESRAARAPLGDAAPPSSSGSWLRR